MPIAPPLSTGFGYGIVLGLGFAFALGMITTTYVLKRYNSEVQTSEMFSTAGRTVKSGLVASAVVSSWTWAATLLQVRSYDSPIVAGQISSTYSPYFPYALTTVSV